MFPVPKIFRARVVGRALPLMAYSGRLRPKELSFSGFRLKGRDFTT